MRAKDQTNELAHKLNNSSNNYNNTHKQLIILYSDKFTSIRFEKDLPYFRINDFLQREFFNCSIVQKCGQVLFG